MSGRTLGHAVSVERNILARRRGPKRRKGDFRCKQINGISGNSFRCTRLWERRFFPNVCHSENSREWLPKKEPGPWAACPTPKTAFPEEPPPGLRAGYKLVDTSTVARRARSRAHEARDASARRRRGAAYRYTANTQTESTFTPLAGCASGVARYNQMGMLGFVFPRGA